MPDGVPPNESASPVDSDDDHGRSALDGVRAQVSRILQGAKERTGKASETVRRLAQDARTNIDRRALDRRRDQTVRAILERWVDLNRETLAEDRQIKDMFLLLDAIDEQLGEATSAEDDGDANETTPTA